MRPKVTTQLIAVSVALFFAFAGAVSTADAGRGGGGRGGGGHGGGGHHAGGGGGGHGGGGRHMSGAYKGGSAYKGGGSYKGGGKSGKHYAHGGNWNGKHNSHNKGKYSHYRRYGYPWYGLPAYAYGGGCGWLYRRAIETDSAYWWNRYNQCTGTYY